MLKYYEVSNFKSFREKTKFSLERTNYHTLSQTNLHGNLLKGLLFVGANASGKSNSLQPLKFLLDSLLGKLPAAMDTYTCLFSDDPVTSLTYVFDVDSTEILYHFEYQKIDAILRETLQVDEKVLLTRDGSVAKAMLYEEQIYTDVPRDILFLRDIYFNTKFRGWKNLQHWFEFLSNSTYIDLCSGDAIHYSPTNLSLSGYLEREGTDEINHFFQEYRFNQSVEYNKSAIGQHVTIEAPEKTVFFRRTGLEEPIPFRLESLGNQTLLQLLPSFFHCVKNGGLLLLDEFSSGFHNDLESLLIRYFMTKSDRAQLIFVSHSTNLLSTSILRPDQIYAVEFDRRGSKIHRFSEEKPREAQNLEKMYMGGVFGGMPEYEYQIQ